jgi:UDP-2,3-diacylglucosamine pyrophosphatase LpxH
MKPTHQVFIISDLHLGGRPASAGTRGFQMMTHANVLAEFIQGLSYQQISTELIIAGDFLDFLAEESGAMPRWVPVIDDPQHALRVFLDIAADPERGLCHVFHALKLFTAAGHRVTLLLGNHDIELSYPAVRSALRAQICAPGTHNYQFIYDGEAYSLGNALIEHGNRYDAFNVIDHDLLRRRRSLQSRSQEVAVDEEFSAPIGSHLVAEIMNPLKERYAFIDLLKPETEAVLPLLLALEPGVRGHLASLVSKYLASLGRGTRPFAPDVPIQLADASANPASTVENVHSSLTSILDRAFGSPTSSRAFLDSLFADAAALTCVRLTDASSLGAIRGLVELLTADKNSELKSRLPPLHAALRVLQSDRSFETDYETSPDYYRAAQRLSTRTGSKFVVFGHTHLARDIALGNDARYLNSGTWTNLLRVPPRVLSEGPESAAALMQWVTDLKENKLQPLFRPTYVRLDMDDNGQAFEAVLLEYGKQGT